MADTEEPAQRPLSRESILDAALVIADDSGLEAVSMRKVAGGLGVTAMSLYNYFASKDELVDAMLDRVIAEIELPEESDWKTAIRVNSASTKAALLRHSWAARIWLTQQGGIGPARLVHSDWLLRTLRQSGLRDSAVFHTYHILESYILGSTLQQLGFPYQGDELATIAEEFLDGLPANEYPDFARHVEQHLSPQAGTRTGFDFALDLILDGLDRISATKD